MSFRRFLPLLVATAALLSVNARAAKTDWDLKADTWVATDALGRSLPTYPECGPVKTGKFVGIFYFIWLGAHGTGGPYDITRILAEDPVNPKWGPPGAFHHWHESELGYYLSNDPYVIRKHCAMLVEAGIDTIILDVTNAITYPQNYLLIGRVFDQIRRQGGRTPQMCFITNSASDKVVQKLYDEFYSKGLYSDLWFRWQGKPLIFTDPGNMSDTLKSFFTVRHSWAWHDPNGWFADGKDKWPWLDRYPQAFGWHEPGKPEEVAVCVAEHPTTNIGRSCVDGKEPDPANQRPAEGLHFAQQWRRALEIDPEFIFVTGWNEWVAQRFLNDGDIHLAGKKLAKGETFFVDTLSQEYSRDIEPMKGGHTDNYYYQLIDNVRRFKGVRKPEAPAAPRTVRIDGRFDDWKGVSPEYRDVIGDTEHRLSKGWGSAGSYINNTGRNDFVRVKVAYDSQSLYFYAETNEPITSYKDPNWMMLFIDSDGSQKTGWNGYDYLVNGGVIDSSRTTLKRSLRGWDWKDCGKITYAVKGNKLEMSIPRAMLGKSGTGDLSFDFHWADNIQKADDIIEFAVNGDSAPDRRFNYRFSTKTY